MSSFKQTGEYDAQIREFEACPIANCIFVNFWPFIVNKFAKQTKKSKTTAKSVRFGIANAATTKTAKFNELTDEAAEAAGAISKIVHAL